MSQETNERMRNVSERVDLALNAEKDDSFMEFKPSDIQLFIDESASLHQKLEEAEKNYVSCCSGRAYLEEERMKLQSQLDLAVGALEKIANSIEPKVPGIADHLLGHAVETAKESLDKLKGREKPQN